MTGRKETLFTAGLVLAGCLISAALTAWVMDWCGKNFMTGSRIVLAAACGFAGFLLLGSGWLYQNLQMKRRIQALTEYLEQANLGKAAILSAVGEDAFSRLEDEIYKTVTWLYQTREDALQIKNGFADNLSNIAHQLKTPLTAISLSVQSLQKQEEQSLSVQTLQRQEEQITPVQGQKQGAQSPLIQIQKQLALLSHLEEALLLLARLDAGTLVLDRQETDVYTLLVLAADNLQELLTETDTTVEIPEAGSMAVTVDLDWTMEAVMNLLKNCMEHHPGGVIHCAYEQNPLYTRIVIWDEGKGFCKEDMPHLFERFYRGRDAREGGIGIGLALAKEIIARQNGTIRAANKPGAGACFEIRIYCH